MSDKISLLAKRIINSGLEYSAGGHIHIKPENRGKFTALKERTGHSATWFKEHGTPSQKKMATFALNSKHWNHRHAAGGLLRTFEEGGDKDGYRDQLVYWATNNPGALWTDNDQSYKARQYLEKNYPEDFASLYWAESDDTRKGIDQRMIPVKARERRMEDAVRTRDAAAPYVAGALAAPVVLGEALSAVPFLPQGGTALAKGIDWAGKMAMPSTFLKGVGSYLPWFSGTAAALSPYADAAAMSYWSGQGWKAAEDAWRDKQYRKAVAYGALSALPIAATGYGVGKSLLIANRYNHNISPEEISAINDNLVTKVTPEATVRSVVTPYEIERYPGYMLKSLMEGNPLEKQLSKSGTVNVNNIKALLGKGSKVERAVVDKVLSSDDFIGKKAIDYNKFRKAVQDELITYDRTPDKRYENYGGESLNWGGSNKDIKEWALSKGYKPAREKMPYERDDEWPSLFVDPKSGEVLTVSQLEPLYKKEHGVELATYTFSSPRIPIGSGKHYNANTLGHSRTYTTADEPDVLHVMESQSDWGQSYKKMNLDGEYNQKRINSLERRINNLKESINSEMEGLRTEKMNDGSDMSPWFADSLRKQIEKDKQLLEELTVELDMRRNPKSATQQDYLAENFTSRQIQENLRYAAEKGQTKMRYPTKETAAKIEGYPKREAYFDAGGNDITASGQKLFTYGERLDSEIEALQKERAAITSEENWGLVPENNSRVAEINRRLSDIVKENEPSPLPGITKKTVYDYEDILKRYEEFPKQYKKLFKGSDVRTVTDSKGNTWYEVDVPESYLQQEWAFRRSNLAEWLNKHPLARDAVKNYLDSRGVIGRKYKEKVSYEDGAADRDSDEAVAGYFRDIVNKIAERENGDGFSFESDYLDTRRFVPESSLGKGETGHMIGSTGVAEYPANASGTTKVHEHRHQRDPEVFDESAHARRLAKRAAAGHPVDVNSPEYSSQFIGQIKQTPQQEELLAEAYPNIKDKTERTAVNRELGYYFYDAYYRIFGKYPNVDEYTAFIEELGPEDIAKGLASDIGYMKLLDPVNAFLSRKRTEAIKKSIIKVAAIGVPLGVGTGAALSSETTKDNAI